MIKTVKVFSHESVLQDLQPENVVSININTDNVKIDIISLSELFKNGN